jgi:N,N'-diacetylchitobiose transport system substrate-binding protein
MEDVLKRKIATAIAVASVFGLAACSSSSSGGATASTGVFSTSGSGKTITVWLMSGDQTGMAKQIAAANAAFKTATGAKVNVEIQSWTNYTTKLDAALLSGTAPDALEIGNTQTAKYIASGSFVNLTSVKSQFDNSGTWLTSLAQSGEDATQTKTYAVPFYAGARVLIYNKTMFAAAGVTTPPTDLADLQTDLAAVKAKYSATVPNFSALYLPGGDWYTASSFGTGGYGSTKGVIAKSTDGTTWTGTLTDPGFESGVTTWDTLQKNFSVGGANDLGNDQDTIMAKGQAAAIIGNGWEIGSVDGPASTGGNPALVGQLSTVPIPGSAAGAPTPGFLGGSDLAVPTNAKNAGLGAEWLKIFTDTANETGFAQGGFIPNSTSLMSTYESASQANQSEGQAASAPTFFIPNSLYWTDSDENDLSTAYEAIAGGAAVGASLTTAQTAILGDLNPAAQ